MCCANQKWRLMFLVVACTLVLLVAILPLYAEEAKIPERIGTEKKSSLSAQKPEGVEAKAVYYSKRYNGRRTSSGAIYDPKKLTAAHPSIPLGTQVKVVNLANNRSVVVTVNDRCRKHNYEIIDLSRAAAQKLDFLGTGATKVRIIPINE